jgi:hypothetical protein
MPKIFRRDNSFGAVRGIRRASARIPWKLLILLSSCSPLSEHYSNILPPDPKILVEYTGTYQCSQGPTYLDLQILSQEEEGKDLAIFSFGPLEVNPTVPNGSFLIKGRFDKDFGALELHPVRWITRPAFYSMAGLSGSSADSGRTISGTITGLWGTLTCSTFRIKREEKS